MSDRIHCDHCDRVIPRDLTRLTLHCGTAKADTWRREDNERDYCADCVDTIPLLKNIFTEQTEERDPQAAEARARRKGAA